jgi:hypothetical protein
VSHGAPASEANAAPSAADKFDDDAAAGAGDSTTTTATLSSLKTSKLLL